MTAESAEAVTSPENRESADQRAGSWAINLLVLLALGLIYSALIMDDHVAPAVTRSPNSASLAAGDAARSWLKQQRAAGKAGDLESVYTQARRFDADGKRTDAYLLYFYAARKGHGLSAMALAHDSDPVGFSPDNSITGVAAPFEAYKWYKVAEKAGVSEATGKLASLEQWARAEARKGNPQAQRILLLWQ